MPRTSTPLRPALLAGLTALLLAACGGGNDASPGSGNPPPPPPPPAQGGVVTAVGHAAGTAVSQAIGAAGGQIVLEGGLVTLDVPAGALAQATTLTAQPITNHAHGGTGPAWRFGPEGVQFAKPVTLNFRYGDGDVAGAAPEALGIAFQRADGVWEWVQNPVLDTAARQVRVQATHFSDWALVRGLQLLPPKALVPTGKTQGLRVLYCYPGLFGGGEVPAPLGTSCHGELPAGVGEAGAVKEWAVNGTVGGSGATGTITGNAGGATYTAPAKRPHPATVAASARIDRAGGGQVLLLSDITVVEEGEYAGTAEFSARDFSGTAQVAWTLADDGGDVRTYAPSGTLDLDIRMAGCEPARRSIAIDDATSSGVNAFMQVMTASAPAYAKSHVFVLSGKEPVTLQCGTPRQPRELPGMAFSVQVGSCGGLQTHPYSDEAVLAGSFSCPQSGVDSVRWRFEALR